MRRGGGNMIKSLTTTAFHQIMYLSYQIFFSVFVPPWTHHSFQGHFKFNINLDNPSQFLSSVSMSETMAEKALHYTYTYRKSHYMYSTARGIHTPSVNIILVARDK